MFYNCCFIFQSLTHVQFFASPWTAGYQASLSFNISQSLLKLMSIESKMISNHLILCCPLLLRPSVLPSIRVFSSESVLCIWWPKYWSFSFSISPSNEYSGLISFQRKSVIFILDGLQVTGGYYTILWIFFYFSCLSVSGRWRTPLDSSGFKC